MQQWLGDVKEKQEVFSSLEEEMQRAQAVCKHLFELHNERSLDLERHQEKAVQLKDRWRNIQTQIETRSVILLIPSFFLIRIFRFRFEEIVI